MKMLLLKMFDGRKLVYEDVFAKATEVDAKIKAMREINPELTVEIEELRY